VSDHVFGDGCLREFDSDLQQLTVNARSAPARIGKAHLADEIANFRT
jgi:phage baseplate assembly protein gpV